jgi:hypothetical protein
MVLDRVVELASFYSTHKYRATFARFGIMRDLVFNGEFHLLIGGPKRLNPTKPRLACFRKYFGVRGMGDFLLVNSPPHQVLEYDDVVHSHTAPGLWVQQAYYTPFRKLTSIRNPLLEAKGLCFCRDSVAEAWVAIAQSFSAGPEAEAARVRAATPQLLEQGYREFNLVAFAGKVFAVAQCLGPTDLVLLEPAKLEELRGKEQVYVADSTEQAKHWIDQLHERLQPRLFAPPYREFNLVAYRGSVWASAQSLVPLDLAIL